MNTATVKVGDIIEVDKNGRLFFALVAEKRRAGAALAMGAFGIKPITNGVSYRSASGRRPRARYRRSKASRVPAGLAT